MRGLFALRAVMKVQVSPQDAHLLLEFVWHQSKEGYVRRWDKSSGKPRLLGLHRQIMGDPPGMLVDHINGDPSDNRRENLRVCSKTENNRNASIRRHNALGIKGVYFDPRRETYRAQIVVDGKKMHLGSFKTAPEAKDRYDSAAKHFHREFARLN